MSSQFAGFPPEALTFLRGLSRNNNRDWFQPRKAVFEEKVKAPMRELVERLNASLKGFAPELITDPAKAIYRIYRDTRFSPNKKPYKDYIAASFHRRGTVTHGQAGYYIAVSHKEVAIGGGVYMPEPPELLAIRQHIADEHEALRKLLAGKTLRKLLGELQGEQLTRVPKGFCADHPAADLLRFKRFILYVTLPSEQATTPQLYGEILTRFKAMKPFLDFLTAPRRKEK
jgi:uncharacterized protein (TIGR02453 family)